MLGAISAFIPCLRYTTADTGTNSAISLAELMSNSWTHVRTYLFTTGDKDPNTVAFSQTVLVCVIVLVLLFAVGAIMTVWNTVGAIRYLNDSDKKGQSRALFLTLFPNRAMSLIYTALTLPVLAFPHILVTFYEDILYYSVILNFTFAPPILVGGVLYVITLILCVSFTRAENIWGLNPYKKRTQKISVPSEPDIGEPVPEFESDAERERYELVQKSREEQADRIRKLLFDADEKDDK